MSNKQSIHRLLALTLLITLTIQGEALSAEETNKSGSIETQGLIGDWCREKKRFVTVYSIKEGTLNIRGGRSGRTYQAGINCNEDYSTCEANTIRGWESPVTEIMQLEGDKMNLTRIWGGAWNDKTYQFIFSRCPKW